MQKRKGYLPYGLHCMDKSDIEAVARTLKSGWITQGPKIGEFEKRLASFVGTKRAVAVNSGTAALELAARACGVENGARAITSPLSFVASANAMLFNNADVDFADIDRESFNIDPALVEESIGPETRAILPVHFAGRCCRMDKIMKAAKGHGLAVIEDCAHALGAEFGGKKAGSFGNAGCFSFHPVKHITMGEGGAVATNDKGLAERVARLRSHGIDKDMGKRFGAKAGYEYDVVELSRNFRVSDIGCALALSQFERLESFLRKREEIAKRYNEAFEGIAGVEIPKPVKNGRHAWHLYCLLVEKRDSVFKFLREQNIGVNVHYIPIYRHSLYMEKYGLKPEQFPNTEHVAARILSLPIFPTMKDADVDYVAAKLREGLKRENVG
jgi:dTDP-4-amino-4,6-dideoxygalactose transaminase